MGGRQCAGFTHQLEDTSQGAGLRPEATHGHSVQHQSSASGAHAFLTAPSCCLTIAAAAATATIIVLTGREAGGRGVRRARPPVTAEVIYHVSC